MEGRRSFWRGGAVAAGALTLAATLMTSCEGNSPTAATRVINPPQILMQIVSGSGQTAPVGTTLPDPLVVEAKDSRGHPQAGQVVNFVVVSGGGSVYAGTGITDSNGLAQDYWTLGPTAGQQVLEARAVDPETGDRLVFATFTADAVGSKPTLSEQSLSFASFGDTVHLSVSTASPSPAAAGAKANFSGAYTWSSSDTSVVTVDATGLVRSVGDGDALVVVSDNQGADTATAHVQQVAASVQVTPGNAAIETGDTLSLTASAADANGYPVQGASVAWASDNASVATVSNSGAVVGVAPGQDTVVATSGPASGMALVSVAAPPPAGQPSISLSPGLTFAALQDTATLGVTAADASGNPLQASQLTWVSRNQGVATVSASGLVKSIGNGNTYVVVSYGTAIDSATVSVAQKVSTVSVSPSSASMNQGETLSLKASAADAKGIAVAGASFTWSSANSGVASVDATGTVTAKSAGSTTVTAVSSGVSGKAQISVADTASTPPQVSISPSSLSFASLQDTSRLSVTAKDGSGNALTASQLTWTSTRTSVATVSSTGLVRSAGNGNALVIASYGGVADTTSVTVAQAVASLAVSPSSLSMTVGDTQTLTATGKDALGNTVSGITVTWTTDNATVATVSSAGVVTAADSGSATITATSNGKSASASVTVAPASGGQVATGWPNVPAGYVMWNDQPWNALGSNGWQHFNRESESRIVSDATAPMSPTNVLEQFYPAGYPGFGTEPAVDFIQMSGRKAIYFGAWFKASPNWQGHSSNINKIFFFFDPVGNKEIVFALYGPAPNGPFELRPVAMSYPDSRNTYLPQNVHEMPMSTGQWHRIEIQLISGQGNGVIRWWQDGVMLGQYTDFNYPTGGFGEVQIAPTWGGVGNDVKQHDDYYRFDHVMIAIPGSGGGSGGGGGSGQASVASVTVSPSSASVAVGSTTTLAATVADSAGNTLTGQTVTWSSSATSVATVSSSGVVTGVAAGNATITATSGGVSGTAQVSVTAGAQTTAPGTVTDLQVVSTTDSSATLQWTQVDDGTGNPANYALRNGTPTISWGSAGATQVLVSGDAVGTLRTYTWQGLQPGTTYQFQLVAYRGTPDVNAVYGALSGTATGQTAAAGSTPPPTPSGQLVSEGFESSNLAPDGWFDATNVSIANDARPGSSGTHSLEWHWTTGSTTPQGSSRIDFTPSSSVYMSYWIKFSPNWIGSGTTYHPHTMQMITTADDHYIGPSITHLTVYDEMLYLNGNLTASPAIQDALMIDENNLNVDLTGVTEQRSIGGYNGQHEFDDSLSTVTWDLYLYSAGQHTNYKVFRPKAVTISDATKNQWHHVEVYWQMNSIVNGIGQQDGILTYVVDGVTKIDRHNVYFRTGANPTMQFRTLLLAPYIGVGSPVDQYMRIDDLTLDTKKP